MDYRGGLMEIRTKAEFLALSKHGLLGNRLRQWETVTELGDSGYTGLLSIRGRKADMRTAVTHVPFKSLGGTLRQILFNFPQYKLEDLYFSESAPDGKLLLQGEYTFLHTQQHVTGHYLCYSTARGLSMREAMKEGFQELEGIRVLHVLRSLMSPNSWDDFIQLRERYPYSVIEFGIYGDDLGNLPGRNTIIWEVRNY